MSDTEYRIRISRDPDPESPREWDNPGIMVCWHSRYLLGDIQPEENAHQYRTQYMRGAILLPLYLLDHSGITMRVTPFGDQWDSGQVGWIYMTPERVSKEGLTEEQALARLRSEVEVYDQYLRGDIYEFVVESRPREVYDIEGNRLYVEVAWDIEDSCGGFYGRDPFKNGMSEHIDGSMHDLLREAAVDC